MKIKFQWIFFIIFLSFPGLYQGAASQSKEAERAMQRKNQQNEANQRNDENKKTIQDFKKILESLDKKNNNGDYNLEDLKKNLLKERTNIEILLDKIKQNEKQKTSYDVFYKNDFGISERGLKYIQGLVNFYNTTVQFPNVHQQAIKLIEKSLEGLNLRNMSIDFISDSKESILYLLNNSRDVLDWDSKKDGYLITPTPLTIAVKNISHCLALINQEPHWMEKVSQLQNKIKNSINDKKTQAMESIGNLLNQKPQEFLNTIIEIINGNGIRCYNGKSLDEIMETVGKSFENTRQYVNRTPWPSEFQMEYKKLIKDLKDNNQPSKPNEKSENIYNKTIDTYQSTINGLIVEAQKQNNNYLKTTMKIALWYITDKVVRENGGIQYLKKFDEKFLTYDVGAKEYLFYESQIDSESVLGGIKNITPTMVEDSLEHLKNPTKALDLINAIDIIHVTLDEKNILTNNDRNIQQRFKSIKEGVDFVATEIKKILETQTATEDEKKIFNWSDFHNKFIINNRQLLPSLIAIDFIFSLEQNKESFAKLKALSDDDIFKMDPDIYFENDEIEKKIKEGSPWPRLQVASSSSRGSGIGGPVIGGAAGAAAAGGAYYKLIANRRKYIQTKTKETSIIQILNTDAGRQQVATGLKSGVVKTLDNTKYLADKGIKGFFGGIKQAGNFLSGSYNLIAEKLKSAPKVLLNK